MRRIPKLAVLVFFASAFALAQSDDLVNAARLGNLSVVGTRLKSGATTADLNNALGAAVSNGRLEVVKALLAAKADPDQRGLLLTKAIDMNYLEIARALVEAGMDLKFDGGRALRAAACKNGPGSVALVQALLAAHSDVNATDNSGRTPLMLAAERGHLEIVRVLFGANANANAKLEDGRNALDLAVRSKHEDVADFLRD